VQSQIEKYRAKAKEFARLTVVARSLRHIRQYRKLAEMYWRLRSAKNLSAPGLQKRTSKGTRHDHLSRQSFKDVWSRGGQIASSSFSLKWATQHRRETPTTTMMMKRTKTKTKRTKTSPTNRRSSASQMKISVALVIAARTRGSHIRPRPFVCVGHGQIVPPVLSPVLHHRQGSRAMVVRSSLPTKKFLPAGTQPRSKRYAV
jgi:hypothetical protein